MPVRVVGMRVRRWANSAKGEVAVGAAQQHGVFGQSPNLKLDLEDIRGMIGRTRAIAADG